MKNFFAALTVFSLSSLSAFADVTPAANPPGCGPEYVGLSTDAQPEGAFQVQFSEFHPGTVLQYEGAEYQLKLPQSGSVDPYIFHMAEVIDSLNPKTNEQSGHIQAVCLDLSVNTPVFAAFGETPSDITFDLDGGASAEVRSLTLNNSSQSLLTMDALDVTVNPASKALWITLAGWNQHALYKTAPGRYELHLHRVIPADANSEGREEWMKAFYQTVN